MIRMLHRHAQPIGLDLGADCIKMIQFEPTPGGLVVRAAGQYYFPPDLEPENPQRRDLAIQAVRRLHRENGFRGRQVVSAVADSSLAIKTIRVPEGTPEQIEQAIAEEAAKRLPFDLGTARLAHLDAGRVQQGNDVCREIILLAVQSADIDADLALLTDMGLEPVALDVGPCALFRSCERFLLRHEDRGQVTLLADIGATTSKVVLAHGREIAFVKTFACGGRDINNAVAKSLDLSVREAVNLRESLARGAAGQSAEDAESDRELTDEILAACEPVLAQLAKEISLCLRYHAVTFRGYRPAVLQVSGGEAHHPLTTDYLGHALGIKVVKADPLRHMNTSRVELGQSRRQPAPCWMLATGLALRGLIAPSESSARGAA